MAYVIYNSSASQNGYLERKSVDTSGRLGSLYDALTDNITDRQSVHPSITKLLPEPYICRTFAGKQSNTLISYLKWMDFNDAMKQSILFGMVKPSGVSFLVNHNQTISDNTRFLYYSYRSKEEEIIITREKANQIMSSSPSSFHETHIITKIVWGFEILCIIPIPEHRHADIVDTLLRSICNRLTRNGGNFILNENEKRPIEEIINVAVYGSEACIDHRDTPLLSVLTRLKDWQSHENFHHPLIYTMYSLRLLFNTEQFSEFFNALDPTKSDFEHIYFTIANLNIWIKYLKDLLEKFPKNFSNDTFNQQAIELYRQFSTFFNVYQEFRNECHKILIGARQKRRQLSDIYNVLSDQRYSLLETTQLETFSHCTHSWLIRVMLLERLDQDQIQYISVMDLPHPKGIPLTQEHIKNALRPSQFKEDGDLFVFYANDQLKVKEPAVWEATYQGLISKRQQATQGTILAYADFTNSGYDLKDLSILTLKMNRSLEAPRNNPTDRPIQSNCSPTLQHQSNQPLPTPITEMNGSINGAPATVAPQPHLVQRSMTSHNLNSPTVPHTPTPTSSLASAPSSILGASAAGEHASPGSKCPESNIHVTEINVLLLGESGVGKSTFINAFVNYLMYDTLQQAEQSKPVVLIPVSFLTTVGDQFQEFIVKFGDVDSNEDHEHQGQSVTQQCKSYIFDLNDQLRLRLIDSPGMGDTRGIAQDDRNMDHILTYVNNLSHLNAVCLLLKPNASRLNVFFRSCVNQLFTYLTPICYQNIIFCFTNARATFFAPGDTGPLLRKMLKTEYNDGIPFQKTNTFCFDSESFRYLAAKKCGVTFDDFQKQECMNSWTSSVTESVRLLNFIVTTKPYSLSDYQSPRRAALEISMLARPLMETLRLIIYSLILCKMNMINSRMILNSNSIDVEICSNCATSRIVQMLPLSLMRFQYVRPEINTIQRHQCIFDGTNFLIEYTVKYDVINESAPTNEKLCGLLDNILLKCNKLTQFLKHQRLSAESDPFAPVFERFINEEHHILNGHGDAVMNRRVLEILGSVKDSRIKSTIQANDSNEKLSLDEIHQIIKDLKSLSTVKKQIDSIMESRRLKMKAFEYQIKTNFVKNKIFTNIFSSN